MSNGSQDYGTGITTPVEPMVTKREYDLVVADYEKLRKEFTEYQDADQLTAKHRSEIAQLERLIQEARQQSNIAVGKHSALEVSLAREKNLVDILASRLVRADDNY